MVSEGRVLRSTRREVGLDAKVNPTLPTTIASQVQTLHQDSASKQEPATQITKATKAADRPTTEKRKQPPTTTEPQLSETPAAPKQGKNVCWYLCPVKDCDAGYAVSRNKGPLETHYKTRHPDLAEEKPWQSIMAEKVDFVAWLSGETKGKVPEFMRKKYATLLHDDGSGSGGVPPEQPRTVEDVLRELRTSPCPEAAILPPAKRQKLDELLEQQKSQVQQFVEEEVRVANERAVKAEAKLERLTYEREAEMARDNARMREMEKQIAELEKRREWAERNRGSS